MQNLRQSYTSNSLGRNADVDAFIKLLNQVEGPYSIALDSDWGSGKTFFVKQAKMHLDGTICPEVSLDSSLKVKTEKSDSLTVYYDAWENEGDVDPLLSIIYSIVDELDVKFEGKCAAQVVDKAVDIISIFQKILGCFIPGISAVAASEVADVLKPESMLEMVRSKRDISKKINDFFESISNQADGRIVIFIDELDRCSPYFAIKLLERLSHYLKHGNITYVFSTNIEQLQYSIKQFYGEGFNATRYLDKFFTLRISLKPVELDPAAGSGSLLLQAKKQFDNHVIEDGFFGQEINHTTYNLARMNMFLHNVNYDKFQIALGNTLLDPKFGTDKPFDAIVSNPPYSINWVGSDDPTLINDDRFAPAGVLAPKSKADFAFVMHSLNYLSAKGRAVIVCFPGIFYRGGAEQKN